MARLDLRVRLLGHLIARTSVARLGEAGVLRMQKRHLPHNRVTDLLLGGLVHGVTVGHDRVEGVTGHLKVRSYRPANAGDERLPLVVNFHGGGWSLGSLDQADWLCSNVALGARVAVVSVDYRLAPKYSFPAGIDDCYAALCEIAARAAHFGGDPDRIAVMGDSAGGNLAAAAALRARDHAGPKLVMQALLYPATDLTLASPSLEENADAPILTRDDCVAFRDHYLQGHDPADPSASPLLAASHRGLPPALVQVAEHDPLRDDGVRYAEALAAAGVPVRLTTYVGMPHGYLSFPRICRAAPQALSELCAELRGPLGAEAGSACIPGPPTPPTE